MQTRRRLTRYAAILSMVGLVAFPLPAAAQLASGGSFVDDDSSVHEGSIEAVAGAGITKGCNPPFGDRFCPDDPVTRGQMAAFLKRALDLAPSAEDVFTDDDGSIFEADIAALAAAGITRGCNPPANDRFCPDEPIIRGQMAAFLRRAYEGTLPEGDPTDFTDDDGTFAGDIAWLSAAGVTAGCNPPANDRFCPDEPVTRGQMATFLARAEQLPATVPPPRGDLGVEVVLTGLAQPTQVVAPPGDDRLFVVEKGGMIRIARDGSLLNEPFVDLRGLVSAGGPEQGLLSLAFHPDFSQNGRVFVYYTGSGGRSVVAELGVSASDPDRLDPATRRTVLTVDQPYANHNGGLLTFGPDGYLYLGLGDGGSGNDPGARARDLGTLLGKLLRIDVDGDDPYEVPSDNPYADTSERDEIWASGLRNPWRFAFDDRGHLYIADVGQNAREEINVVAADRPGVDYGWARYEGTRCNPADPDPSCDTAGLTFPVEEYSHSEGCSVTGGPVYRGSELAELDDYYLYGDLCAGWVRGFRYHDGRIVDRVDLSDHIGTIPGLWSFGTDGDGEVYLVAGGAGTVYRLVREQP